MDDLSVTTAPRASTLSGPADPAARAIERLARSAPEAAKRARPAVDLILKGIRSSCWPEVAWKSSRLTASGCPVEFSFCSIDPALRYTAEITGPEIDPCNRLDLGIDMLSNLSGGYTVPQGLLHHLRRVQVAGSLGWGAWMGARHDANRSRFKLYAEIPRDAGATAADFTAEYLGSQRLLTHRRPRLEGVGHEPESGHTELYFRVDGLDIWETGVLLVRGGHGARQNDVLDLMEKVYARPIRPHLPRHPYGYSFTIDPSGATVAVTLFAYAADVFGSDARARHALLKIGPTLGWVTDGYRQLSAPLKNARSTPTQHTVVAFTALANGPATLTIGLVPS